LNFRKRNERLEAAKHLRILIIFYNPKYIQSVGNTQNLKQKALGNIKYLVSSIASRVAESQNLGQY
jgi:hypothetical protein